MKIISKILPVALSFGLVVSLAGCAQQSGLKDKTKLIVSTNATFEPFEYMDNNQVVGIDVDISQKIADDLGATLQINNMNFDSIIPAVSTGKVDIGVAGISKDPDREKSVDFSEPYYDASQVIIVKKDNTTIKSKEDLKDKKVGVQKATTGDDVATDLVGDANVTRFQASTDAITALKQGKVDAVVIDSFPAKVFIGQNSDLQIVGDPLTSEQYCIAVRKGNQELLDAVNKTIKELKSSGQLDQIIKKYE